MVALKQTHDYELKHDLFELRNRFSKFDALILDLKKSLALSQKLLEDRDKTIAVQAKTIEAQTKDIAILKERIAELERRTKANSTNSSKPSSTDGLAKPPPKSLREKSEKKPGGQEGHKGINRAQLKNPNTTILYTVEQCPCCQTDLSGVKPSKNTITRQVVDIYRARS